MLLMLKMQEENGQALDGTEQGTKSGWHVEGLSNYRMVPPAKDPRAKTLGEGDVSGVKR